MKRSPTLAICRHHDEVVLWLLHLARRPEDKGSVKLWPPSHPLLHCNCVLSLHSISHIVASLHCSTLLNSYRNCLHECALPLYLGTYWLSALHCLPYDSAYEGSVKLWPPFLLHYSSTLASLQHSSLLMADRNSLNEFTLPLFTSGQLSWSWTFLYAST